MQNDWLTFVNLLLITVYLSILRLLLKYNKHVEKCAHISAQLNNFFPNWAHAPSQIKKQHVISTPVVFFMSPSSNYLPS